MRVRIFQLMILKMKSKMEAMLFVKIGKRKNWIIIIMKTIPNWTRKRLIRWLDRHNKI
jgi:hypothetical protein